MAITTSLTRMLDIQHPILLAGMGQTSGATLAAAVSNAGGLGVVGGIGYMAARLTEMLTELKSKLREPSLPFGVDLLIPQVGGSARKTNKDYTKGNLNELIDVIVESGAKLFVSAVGVPPKDVVDRLHGAGILYMNMVGHPKHVHKACKAGADIICAQGGEAGGHTGDVPTSVLIPACADICKQYKSPLTGNNVELVAAGGVYDGRSLASALMLGASGVWVGTRFVATPEAGAPEETKRRLVESGFDSTILTSIFTGRQLRLLATPHIVDWERNRQDEIRTLQSQGVIPLEHELDKLHDEGKLTEEIEDDYVPRPQGVVAGMVNNIQPAGEIVQEMADEAFALLSSANKFTASSKL